MNDRYSFINVNTTYNSKLINTIQLTLFDYYLVHISLSWVRSFQSTTKSMMLINN